MHQEMLLKHGNYIPSGCCMDCGKLLNPKLNTRINSATGRSIY